MLTTKRYDYVPFDQIYIHPAIENHRAVNERKVAHYADDILKNGLLEPLIVWERKGGEYFLVGGFHRHGAIQRIRAGHPGYFDRVDVRVVDGELDEMQALNLKLNADRLDAKITDYFDAVIFMKNANWSKERIAQFLDKSESWIDEILRFAPGMDSRVRKLLSDGRISWVRAKAICRAVLEAAPGKERETLERLLAELEQGSAATPPPRPLTFRSASKRLAKQIENDGNVRFSVTPKDLLALVQVLRGRGYSEEHLDRVRQVFPGLIG